LFLALILILACLHGSDAAQWEKKVVKKGDCSAGVIKQVRRRRLFWRQSASPADHRSSPQTHLDVSPTPSHSLTRIDTTTQYTQGDRAYVHYRGYLVDGTEFDSSYSRNTPLSFPAGDMFVIKCWDEGVIGMCVGEEIRMTCPPETAYGDRGAGDVIPPDATLTFDMKLVRIGAQDDE